MRQVSRQMRHHIAADKLPSEVIILTLAVLALVWVAVLLEGAASCGERDLSDPTETPQSSWFHPKSPARMMCYSPKNTGGPQTSPHVHL